METIKKIEITPGSSRITAEWSVWIRVDYLHAPRDAGDPGYRQYYAEYYHKLCEIGEQARIATGHESIEYCTRSVPKRAEIERDFRRRVMADYRAAGKKGTARRIARIGQLQRDQAQIIKQMRAANSRAIMAQRTAAAEKQAREQAALAEGRFWECEAQTLKSYFHPPFAAKALVDVSERWRAALFAETKSVNASTQKGRYWHKSEPTGRGWLCGIDDNGDEWGFRLPPAEYVEFGDTVESAMAAVFDVPAREIQRCDRQGEILFRPVKIITEPKTVCSECGAKWDPAAPAGDCRNCGYPYAEPKTINPPKLKPAPHDRWQPADAHTVWSPGLRVNGRHIRSDREITVTHPTHAMLVLPPGEYNIRVHSHGDAD